MSSTRSGTARTPTSPPSHADLPITERTGHDHAHDRGHPHHCDLAAFAAYRDKSELNEIPIIDSDPGGNDRAQVAHRIPRRHRRRPAGGVGGGTCTPAPTAPGVGKAHVRLRTTCSARLGRLAPRPARPLRTADLASWMLHGCPRPRRPSLPLGYQRLPAGLPPSAACGMSSSRGARQSQAEAVAFQSP
ncbi:MAG: hypothetical protein JWM19_2347 [Actinomycetia bacterium]|nr:hypothetical protein [Actinomycetes bacterium]